MIRWIIREVITAIGAGTATITVTATKDGTAPLTQTIDVTVAAAGSSPVKEESLAASDGVETTVLSGNVLTSGGADGITVNGNTVTIHAKSSAAGITSSKVVIPQETAKALADKTVIVETNTGSITLDSTLVGKIASAGSDVTLTLAKSECTAIRTWFVRHGVQLQPDERAGKQSCIRQRQSDACGIQCKCGPCLSH